MYFKFLMSRLKYEVFSSVFLLLYVTKVSHDLHEKLCHFALVQTNIHNEMG